MTLVDYLKSFSVVFVLAATVHSIAKEPNIVTTTSTLQAIAQEIAPASEVFSLTKGSQDPHYIEARPSHIAKVRSADLLISIGLGLEDAWLKKVIEGSRNTKLQTGQPGHLITGLLISPIDIPKGKITRAMGDVHPEGNPHFLLDPMRAILVGKGIADRLSTLFPEKAKKYQTQASTFEKQVTERISIWNKKLSSIEKKQLITYHSTLNYFLAYFNLEALGSIEIKPGIPPSAKHIQTLTTNIKKQHISCLLLESFFDPTPAQSIKKQTNIKVVRVAPEVGALEKTNTYFAWMDHLVDATALCLTKS